MNTMKAKAEELIKYWKASDKATVSYTLIGWVRGSDKGKISKRFDSYEPKQLQQAGIGTFFNKHE